VDLKWWFLLTWLEDVIFMCGTKIDFKKMRDVLKMKTSPEKDEALEQLDLGCNMKMKEAEVDFLQKTECKH